MNAYVKMCLGAALALGVGNAAAENHALIMTISAYRAGITRLEGVKHDAASARAIARKMGVKDQNMRVYRDEQLTLEGIRTAFTELYERIGADDQVFIYYSGHGGRERLKEGRCAESLISVDGQAFIDEELEKNLKRLSEKARRLVVFLDACHSGGVSTRATPGARTSGITPKYAARAGADVCDKPVNVLTRSLGAASRSPGSGANNYVYIAAARDNEVSLDMATHGGVATQAWRDCITGAARDLDGSGGISAAEIQACAQERIDNALKSLRGFLPHHVTITGNPSAVLAFSERAPQPPKPVATPPKPSSVASEFPPAYHTLRDIYANRDDRRTVTLTAAKPVFKINQDKVDFTVTSSHAGHLYILMVGSDGKTFDMLFPNGLDGNNKVQAGQTLRLPRPNWMVKAGGPAGKNHLIAIVADAARDFSKIGMKPAGPFSIIAATQAASQDIQLVTSTSANAQTRECEQPSLNRNLVVQKSCSNAYGAAMMVLEEMQ